MAWRKSVLAVHVERHAAYFCSFMVTTVAQRLTGRKFRSIQ
jgi:hypothetical protein